MYTEERTIHIRQCQDRRCISRHRVTELHTTQWPTGGAATSCRSPPRCRPSSISPTQKVSLEKHSCLRSCLSTVSRHSNLIWLLQQGRRYSAGIRAPPRKSLMLTTRPCATVAAAPAAWSACSHPSQRSMYNGMRRGPLMVHRDHPSATPSTGMSIVDASYMRPSLPHHTGFAQKCRHNSGAAF